jgi:hypothetical protein
MLLLTVTKTGIGMVQQTAIESAATLVPMKLSRFSTKP